MKAKYIDAFVFVIAKKNIPAYRKMATDASKVWKRFGALAYRECKENELTPKTGGQEMLLFPKLVKPRKGETIWFSYIEYKSKAHRNEVNKKVMAYFDKKYKDAKEMKMPFDMARMSFGGFTVEVSS